jgi:hypothetical protein
MNIATIDRLYNAWKRDSQSQRFGQYVCNHLSITDSKVFFEEDTDRAYLILVEQTTKP